MILINNVESLKFDCKCYITPFLFLFDYNMALLGVISPIYFVPSKRNSKVVDSLLVNVMFLCVFVKWIKQQYSFLTIVLTYTFVASKMISRIEDRTFTKSV